MIRIHNLVKIFKQETLRRGFSIIELLLYMGLLMVLVGVLSSVFSAILDAQLETGSSAEVQQEGEYILAKTVADMRQAQSITTPGSLGNSSSSLVFTISGSPYTYSLDASGNLNRTDAQGTEKLNSYLTSISGLSFTRLGNVGGKNSIRMTFTVTSKIMEHTNARAQTYTTTFSLR